MDMASRLPQRARAPPPPAPGGTDATSAKDLPTRERGKKARWAKPSGSEGEGVDGKGRDHWERGEGGA